MKNAPTLVISILVSSWISFATVGFGADAANACVPYVSISASEVYAKSDEVPDSLRDLNPHRIILWVGPSEDEKVKLTQYYVVPGEPNEWMSETWQDIRFSIFVNLNEDIRFARVIGSRDGERLFEFHSYLSMRQPKIQPVDPDYAARRLEELERMAHAWEEQYNQLAVSTARARDAQFERDPDHWVDQNCTVEANEWGFTNEWVRRELDPHLIRAQALSGVNPNFVRRAEEFFSIWQSGDRLFSYATPTRLQGPVYGEWGYIIVRDCKLVAKLMVAIS
jgi:hypothetical protein